MALGCKQRLEEKTDFFLLTDLPWAILQGDFLTVSSANNDCVNFRSFVHMQTMLRCRSGHGAAVAARQRRATAARQQRARPGGMERLVAVCGDMFLGGGALRAHRE
eukprot:3119268-Prymnesium_polylepis.1